MKSITTLEQLKEAALAEVAGQTVAENHVRREVENNADYYLEMIEDEDETDETLLAGVLIDHCDCSGCVEVDVRDCGWDADGLPQCESCTARNVRRDWMEETERRVEAAAELGGWDVDDRHTAGTGTRYLTLSRYADDDEENVEVIKVRISDHGSAHCSEDYSIAMNPSGDDHNADAVLAKIATPK